MAGFGWNLQSTGGVRFLHRNHEWRPLHCLPANCNLPGSATPSRRDDSRHLVARSGVQPSSPWDMLITIPIDSWIQFLLNAAPVEYSSCWMKSPLNTVPGEYNPWGMLKKTKFSHDQAKTNHQFNFIQRLQQRIHKQKLEKEDCFLLMSNVG